MRRAEVSVVIPTHDRADILMTTIASIIAQEDVRWKLIVVDDASADRTPDVLRDLAGPRIRVLRNERNAGMAATRNRGLEHASAPWVTFCDDDDVWAPTKLRRQLDAVMAAGRDWVYTGAVYVDHELRPVRVWPRLDPEDTRTALRAGSAIPAGASNVLARTDLLRAEGGFWPGLRHGADWDLWVRLARRGLPAAVDAPLVGYRRHQGNDSRRTASLATEVPVLRRRADIEPASYWRWLASGAMEQHDWGNAVRWLVRANRLDASRLRRDVRGLAWHIRRAVTGDGAGAPRAEDPWLQQAEEWLSALRASA